MKRLKGLKILVTAGPTWVKLDRVRVITNIFSGRTGCNIAKRCALYGAKVELLLGPGGLTISKELLKLVKVTDFKFFNELLSLIKDRVSTKRYHIIIHSAAVSDYRPYKVIRGKIKSSSKSLCIKLKPTIKIADRIKRYDPGIFLVKFKLEANRNKKGLISTGYKSMLASKADLIVVNALEDIEKEASSYIIDRNKKVIEAPDRKGLADILAKEISKHFASQTKKRL